MNNDMDLTSEEKKLAVNLLTLWGNSVQDIISTIAMNDLKISNCDINIQNGEEFVEKLKDIPVILQDLTFSGDLLGSAYIMLKREEVLVLIDLIIGGDGTQVIDDFGDLHISIFKETTSQMANSLIGIIANNTSKKVNILTRDVRQNELGIISGETIAEVSYDLELEGKLNGKLWILFPYELMKSLTSIMMETAAAPEPVKVIGVPESAPKKSEPEPLPLTQPAVFGQLVQQEAPKGDNLDLILDIPVSIKAILGKSDLTLRELIEITPGKVIELDKLAGEPVDLVVNDRLVARGEVIVIDEKFGIKVMDVLSKAERIYNLK